MRVVPPVAGPLRSPLLLSCLLLWLGSLAFLAVPLWLLLDPAQSFQLDLVHFSESPPLLKFSCHLMLGTALLLLLAGSVGFFGTSQLERCLLGSFVILILLALLTKMGVVLLAQLSQTGFPNGHSMSLHLANISMNRFGRDLWVQPVMDSVHFYHQCCGGNGPGDFAHSFWFLTNTERGTRSFVPWSCCRQSQHGRAWALSPVDPLCIQYQPWTVAFNDSVHSVGCGQRTSSHLRQTVQLLSLTCFIGSIVDLVALGLALKCLRQVWSFYSALEFANL